MTPFHFRLIEMALGTFGVWAGVSAVFIWIGPKKKLRGTVINWLARWALAPIRCSQCGELPTYVADGEARCPNGHTFYMSDGKPIHRPKFGKLCEWAVLVVLPLAVAVWLFWNVG